MFQFNRQFFDFPTTIFGRNVVINGLIIPVFVYENRLQKYYKFVYFFWEKKLIDMHHFCWCGWNLRI